MIIKYIIQNNNSIKSILKDELKLSSRLIRKLSLLNCVYKSGNTIHIDLRYEEDNSNIVPKEMSLDIIHEDESLLIINKPVGIVVHPSTSHYDTSLSSGVKYYFDQIKLKKKIRPVNRLDRDTSGIVIFAKNEYVQDFLSNNFSKKEYFAILEGILENSNGTIDANIARKENSIIERCISENGETAITHYELIKTFNNLSLVKFILGTGRTHQIRVHSSYIGHPILGDTLYGNFSQLINRQALHAYKVSLIDPITKEAVSYTASIPNDIQKIIE